jgi:FkbM family methyltransferase
LLEFGTDLTMLRRAFLSLGKHLERLPVRHLVHPSVKGLYWRFATSGGIDQVYGSLMRLPPDQRQRDILLNRYEPAVTRKIEQILKPGMSFCDVGANIGIFTLLAARLVGPSGRVIAFEPIPDNAVILRENIRLNGYGQVTLHEKAVTISPTIVKLYLSSFRGSHSMLPEPARFTGRTHEVEGVRLDLFPALAHIDLMKVDVEGLELQVLESLGTYRPRNLILEYNPERERAAGVTQEEFVRALRKLGYGSIVNLDAPGAVVERSGEGNLFCSDIPLLAAVRAATDTFI